MITKKWKEQSTTEKLGEKNSNPSPIPRYFHPNEIIRVRSHGKTEIEMGAAPESETSMSKQTSTPGWPAEKIIPEQIAGRKVMEKIGMK